MADAASACHDVHNVDSGYCATNRAQDLSSASRAEPSRASIISLPPSRFTHRLELASLPHQSRHKHDEDSPTPNPIFSNQLPLIPATAHDHQDRPNVSNESTMILMFDRSLANRSHHTHTHTHITHYRPPKHDPIRQAIAETDSNADKSCPLNGAPISAPYLYFSPLLSLRVCVCRRTRRLMKSMAKARSHEIQTLKLLL